MASSSTSVKTYDVFISFRGTDTRTGFTSFLYEALHKKGIKTFIDSADLQKGDEISPVLLGAIEASTISLIVLSENYAESRWCLDELNHIVRCKEERGQLVLPVFYKVDPTNIRHQSGSFRAAFSQHKIRFVKEPEKLDRWRKSLTTAANLSGWDTVARSESDLVKEIVKTVTEKLQELKRFCDYTKGVFGIENNIQKIESLLCIGSTKMDTRVVGIWGMGGIGKTRLARVLFDRLSSQFSGSFFLENVREVKKHQSSDLRKRVFSELLDQKNLRCVTKYDIERLKAANVLLVLDNVDHVDQLEHLEIDCNSFGPCGRIVVTSRDVQVLRNIRAQIHEIKELNFADARELFLSKAFLKEESPAKEYSKLVDEVVKKYAKGNPLALTVLGRYLCSKSIKEWKSEMESLEKTPNHEVQEILKVSYDGLRPDLKEIFLDIACFFRGRDRNSTERILGHRYLGAVMGISVLVDRALITENEGKEIWIHDLIQQMGKTIVSQQSINQPEKRSRLWSTSDVCKVLGDNRGTIKMHAVLLKCKSPREITDSLTIGPQVFKKMPNLWFLGIDPLHGNKLLFNGNLGYFPAALRYLQWNYCPLKSLPQSFNPKELCELIIRGRKLQQIWDTKHKDLKYLKVLDLNACESLNQHLDLSSASNLEDLNLSSCSSIDKFPLLPSPNNINCLRMSGTKIEEVPISIECLTRVTILCFDCCYSLKILPTTICKLKSLKILSMRESSKLKHFPKILEPMICLEELLLDVTGIKELHPSIENLTGLKTLSLRSCKNLEKLPNTFSKMQSLVSVNISGCPKLKILPKLPFSIKRLDARGCESLERLSALSIAFREGPQVSCVEKEFDFTDCLELDRANIVTEFRRIDLARNDATVFKSSCVPGVCISLPGEEIPAWFEHQNKGSLVTMNLDQGWNKNLAGVAVCALITLYKKSKFTGLRWESRFAMEHREIFAKSKRTFNTHSQSRTGCNHIVMQSFEADCSDVSGSVQASFEVFSEEMNLLGLESKVTKCGVRLLYRRDAE